MTVMTGFSISPNQFEVCDGLDNNCDGDVDEGVTNTYFADFDSDGYGNPLTTVEDCTPPMGYTSDPNSTAMIPIP